MTRVGLVRLQPDFRIHIKWWVVFVDFFSGEYNKRKKKKLFQCTLSLIISSECITTSSAVPLDPTGGCHCLVPAFQDSDFHPVPPMQVTRIIDKCGSGGGMSR